MKNLRVIAGAGLAVLVCVLMVPVVGIAAEETEGDVSGLIASGKASYLASCASCHGVEATGEGVVAEYLTVKPSDLTQISTGETGEFPFDKIYEVVDGSDVPGHGTREMPVWGPAFTGMDESASKKVIKEKIVELVYYLKSIQG